MSSDQALHQFWSRFGWVAYDASTVPSQELSPGMPRITYEVAKSEFEAPVTLSASLWDESYSWADIGQKADEIYEYIGLGGTFVSYDYGNSKLWIKRGPVFAQRMTDENDKIRRIYLTIEVEYLTAK